MMGAKILVSLIPIAYYYVDMKLNRINWYFFFSFLLNEFNKNYWNNDFGMNLLMMKNSVLEKIKKISLFIFL